MEIDNKHPYKFLWAPNDRASRAFIVNWMKRRSVYDDESFFPVFVNFCNKAVDTLAHETAAPPEYDPPEFAALVQSSLPVESLVELMEWFCRGVFQSGPNHRQSISNGLIKAHDHSKIPMALYHSQSYTLVSRSI